MGCLSRLFSVKCEPLVLVDVSEQCVNVRMEPEQVLLGVWLCAPLEVISRIWIQSSWLQLDELSQKNSLLMRDSNPRVRINRFGRSTIKVSYYAWKHLSGFLQVLEILRNS